MSGDGHRAAVTLTARALEMTEQEPAAACAVLVGALILTAGRCSDRVGALVRCIGGLRHALISWRAAAGAAEESEVSRG